MAAVTSLGVMALMMQLVASVEVAGLKMQLAMCGDVVETMTLSVIFETDGAQTTLPA
jgi:hypothetical protein